MKLSLVVNVGKSAGKVIPITVPQFVIGRDPECHLRPASAIISKKHCAIVVRDGKAYLKDYESTNGSFVNDERVVGERELRDADSLKIGPLDFQVRLEGAVPVDKQTPLPKNKAATGDDEAIAAMLLSMQDDGDAPKVDALNAVPDGSTILDMPAVALNGAAPDKAKKVEKQLGDTREAAEAILAKYSRRKRT